MSESPVRDREQATVERILYEWHSTEMKAGSLSLPSQRCKLAERIVDALLPQPDPEVEAAKRGEIANAQAAERWRKVADETQAALERAEERLRAVTEAAEAMLEALDPWDMLDEVRVAADALRTVLSSHPEAQSTEERT